ncbi:MAG: YfcE family phosphodiesterase [Eubacteriales bacterium]|nr:YfcE family phosphodiesterase [Eubacteriales bacterium]MDD3882740.1 YfcE family phosphodiesterase [Eubacteriales bacterium]MDD4512639.1 YfcE family phosphodiesterase [Eubacteriales bacterium]
MKRLGVFSDSHGREAMLRRAIYTVGRADAYCFCGDGLCDFRAVIPDIQSLNPSAQILMVAGNCDGFSGEKEEITFFIGGAKILMAHGHTRRVKLSPDFLLEEAVRQDARAALFGHTHEPKEDWQNGVLLLNPGSVSASWPSCASLQIDDDGRLRADILLIR